ncbi:hypothetical protein KR093_006900, partial [Drosophila rubida]
RMLRRPITSGSRQAPDPYDQFLESRAMYRKHTARDASCLFRVIAEQMYDTQMLHFEVRLECVRFMTRKRRIFEQHVRGDFDAYMMDMAKPKTYGTMLELRALCCMYRRNVILFEPFNMGTKVTYNERYQENFLVFYTNEFHFDSVYTEDYIEMAAICQSICFKLLYKMLFKLPDVNFAVETMLHPQSFNWNSYNVELDSRGYISRVICADGRCFHLDIPEDTKCILENYKLCHFHSNAVQSLVPADATSRRLEIPLVDSTDMLHMCPSRLNSCVRQLLEEGITPFPYKVAKSLDPFMYRNIEFDSWNDLRKEAKRFNIYANDYNFKVGAKCHVELQIESERQMYTCHIQKIGVDKSYCIVFVEQFGKKYLVPYETVHPVPPDEFRPWTVPYRFQRQMQRAHMAKMMAKPKMAQKWKKTKLFEMGNYFEAGKCEVMQYMQLDTCYGFPQHPSLSAPLETVDEQQQQQQQHQREQLRFQQPRGKQPPRLQPSQPEQQLPAGPAPAGAPYLNYMPMAGRRRLSHVSPSWPNVQDDFPGSSVFQPMQANGCMLMHFSGFGPTSTVPQPQPTLPPPPPPPYAHTSKHASDEHSLHAGNGEDLPTDLSTLRYFYNIGVNTHLGYMHGNTQNQQHNTDQQQQKRRNDEATAAALMANTSTPPPTPEANATVSGIKSISSASSTDAAAGGDKARCSRVKRGAFNKGRGKRPEQLYGLNKENPVAHHAVLLPTPTPTPSPNATGNQFNFYPAAQAPMPPAHQSMSLRPPIYYAPPKSG